MTTTTISAEQHAYATERVREAGLQDRVTVLLEDYRELTGSYDKLVSIEMIEAVGWQYFRTFFSRCSELLRDDGAMLLQAIVIDDRAYEVEKAGRSFMNTHIFPGGCLPSLEVIARTVARVTDFRQVHLEDITAHYAPTLQRWRERFLAAERAPLGSSATTSASAGCGSSTSATARAAFASGASRTCSCCSPSPAFAEPRSGTQRTQRRARGAWRE